MDEYLKILIEKYLVGKLSNGEALKLAGWIKASPGNAALFRESLRRLEEEGQTSTDAVSFSRRISAEKFSGKKSVETSWRKISVFAAASLAAVLCVGALALSLGVRDADKSAKEQLAGNETPAALQPSSPTEKSLVYSAPSGQTREVSLEDGTRVLLNSGARLSLSDGFNVSERRVDLDGEAFFEVARNPEKPFVVCCRDNEYIVRGTSFNVSSYSDDRFSVVTLLSGRLEARVQDDVIMLRPGDELRIDRSLGQISKTAVDISESAGWRDGGKLSFCALPLKFVASQLSHRYGVQVRVHSSVEDIAYDGCIDRESLEEALRLICLTSPVELSLTRFDGEYYISPKSRNSLQTK